MYIMQLVSQDMLAEDDDPPPGQGFEAPGIDAEDLLDDSASNSEDDDAEEQTAPTHTRKRGRRAAGASYKVWLW